MTTFSYTGAQQTLIVPAGVTVITFDVQGAQGGNDTSGTPNTVTGLGGRVVATLSVTPGETLYLNVGGHGASTPINGFDGGIGGWNGGGNGGGNTGGSNGTGVWVGGGGGASDVRRSPIYTDDFNRADALTLGASPLPWTTSDGGVGTTVYAGHDPVGISGNQAYPTTNTAQHLYLAHSDTGSSDMDASVMIGVAPPANCMSGLVFRYQDADNHWRIACGGVGDGHVYLQKVIGGVVTTSGSEIVTHSTNAGDVIRVVATGNSINWYINGLANNTWIDNTSPILGTKHGIFFASGSTGSTAARLDNFTLQNDNRLLVGGGGGGIAYNGYSPGAEIGGHGGADVGQSGGYVGATTGPATGGSQVIWGGPGQNSDGTVNSTTIGSLRVGGHGANPGSGGTGGGGGGGGYYGGGGGGANEGFLSGVGAGGGGGSNYVDPSATSVTSTQGYRAGDGVIITSVVSAPASQPYWGILG